MRSVINLPAEPVSMIRWPYLDEAREGSALPVMSDEADGRWARTACRNAGVR
ncbi:hypothetical protein IU476_12425 [Nocardia blacklockiae]|nr:hypothetical protein [Nocardia blacklockiae]